MKMFNNLKYGFGFLFLILALTNCGSNGGSGSAPVEPPSVLLKNFEVQDIITTEKASAEDLQFLKDISGGEDKLVVFDPETIQVHMQTEGFSEDETSAFSEADSKMSQLMKNNVAIRQLSEHAMSLRINKNGQLGLFDDTSKELTTFILKGFHSGKLYYTANNQTEMFAGIKELINESEVKIDKVQVMLILEAKKNEEKQYLYSGVLRSQMLAHSPDDSHQRIYIHVDYGFAMPKPEVSTKGDPEKTIVKNLSIYEKAYQFAIKPVKEGGLGLYAENYVSSYLGAARDFSDKIASKESGEEYLKNYMSAYQFAIKPANEGGLGLYAENYVNSYLGAARNFAKTHADQKEKEAQKKKEEQK